MPKYQYHGTFKQREIKGANVQHSFNGAVEAETAREAADKAFEVAAVLGEELLGFSVYEEQNLGAPQPI